MSTEGWGSGPRPCIRIPLTTPTSRVTESTTHMIHTSGGGRQMVSSRPTGEGNPEVRYMYKDTFFCARANYKMREKEEEYLN